MIKKSVRNTICAAACIVAAGASTSAMATAHSDVAASAIQISSYGAVAPVLFYAGSVCSSGHLSLDPASTVDVQKTLWAAVLSAKTMGGRMSFDFDFNGDDCIIRSFSVNAN
jgi:hypothetical protein